MLNTVPPPISPLLPALPPLSSPARRPALQPQPLKQGLYAAKNPTSLTLDQLGLDKSPAGGRAGIPGLREHLLQMLLAAPKSNDFRTLLAWHQPILKSVKSIERRGLRRPGWLKGKPTGKAYLLSGLAQRTG